MDSQKRHDLPVEQYLWHIIIGLRSCFLETHIRLRNYTVKEAFITTTFELTSYPKLLGMSLSATHIEVLAICQLRCAVIIMESGDLLQAVRYVKSAKGWGSSSQLLDSVLLGIKAIMISRMDVGYFPQMDSVEYLKAGATGKCTICSKSVSLGEKYIQITACRHSFHQRCLENNLSTQFRSAGLRVHLSRHLAYYPLDSLHNHPFPHWISMEFCDQVLPEASREAGIPMDAKLECPECRDEISYKSVGENQFKGWVLNEQARFWIVPR
jgi:hypothetical protein